MHSMREIIYKRFPICTGTLLISLLLLIQACSPVTPNIPDELQESFETLKPERIEPTVIQEAREIETPMDIPTLPVRKLPTVRAPELIQITPSDPGQPVTGETPASLLEDILADVVERTGAARQEIDIIRDQAVTWSDGSLGCPQPGVFYTQALVPGYWVVLQVGGDEYDYRASERGFFVLCEGGGLPFDQPVDR
jgi:hypothetical protein